MFLYTSIVLIVTCLTCGIGAVPKDLQLARRLRGVIDKSS